MRKLLFESSQLRFVLLISVARGFCRYRRCRDLRTLGILWSPCCTSQCTPAVVQSFADWFRALSLPFFLSCESCCARLALATAKAGSSGSMLASAASTLPICVCTPIASYGFTTAGTATCGGSVRCFLRFLPDVFCRGASFVLFLVRSRVAAELSHHLLPASVRRFLLQKG